MLSLFKTRDKQALCTELKKYCEPKLWSFEVCSFLVKYGFYKAISIVIWGPFWLILTHFWPFFPESSGLDVLDGVFIWVFLYVFISMVFTYLSKKRVGGNTDFVIFGKLRFCHQDVDFRVNLAWNARFFSEIGISSDFFGLSM